ncbi:GNAT family N-acetyltransferase [Lapidilactobacillus salsurivasis]
MLEITLRPVQEVELGTVWQMQQQVFATPRPDQLPFVDSLAQIHWRFRHPQNHYDFICLGGQRIGYLQLQRDKTGQRVQIRPLVLLPAFQRRGIGRHVLTLLEEQTPEIEIWRASLPSSSAALALFAKQGYRQLRPGHWQKTRDQI